jgi:hypothetical protein
MIQTLKHKPHRISAIMPSMSDDEKRDLEADIKKYGLVDPIVLYQGDVLDGVHRQEACVHAGVPPRYIEFSQLPPNARRGGPLGYVISKNLKRRNLSASQRAMVAAEMVPAMEKELSATAEPKRGPGRPPKSGKAVEAAAKTLDVHSDTVRRARKLIEEDPARAADVKSGKISLRRASGRASKADQRKHDLEAAYARIEKVCGKPLADAARRRIRLKQPKDVLEFAGMDAAEMKRVAGLIEDGWKLKKARLFKAKNLTRRHLLNDLMNKAAQAGGDLTVTIDSWRIDITRVRSALRS